MYLLLIDPRLVMCLAIAVSLIGLAIVAHFIVKAECIEEEPGDHTHIEQSEWPWVNEWYQ